MCGRVEGGVGRSSSGFPGLGWNSQGGSPEASSPVLQLPFPIRGVPSLKEEAYALAFSLARRGCVLGISCGSVDPRPSGIVKRLAETGLMAGRRQALALPTPAAP